MSRARLFLLGSFCLMCALPARAGTERSWAPLVRGAMPEGQAQGAAPVSDGTVRLAPEAVALGAPEAPYLWGVVRAGGDVFAAGGDSGVIYRVTGSKAVPAHMASKIGINAIAADGRRLLFGTSPDGALFRLQGKGKPRKLFDPDEKYIWSVAVAGRSYYVATGTPGRVYRVDRKTGESKRLYDGETHVRSLAVDPKGHVLAGTDGRGLLVRLTDDGKPFVLFDAPRREISDITVASDGTVFFSAVGSEDNPNQDPKTGPKAQLFVMRSDGFVEQLWESPSSVIYAVAAAPDGDVWVATGDPGAVYVVERDGVARRIWESEADQVTDLQVTDSGVLASTGNPARIVRLPWKAGAVSGTFMGKALDAGGFSRWGRVNVNAETAGGQVAIQTRSGNTEEPDDTWSAWSKPLGVAGGVVSSPPARYLQWKVTLTGSESSSAEPVLRFLEIYYRPANRAPEVTEVTIEPPGVTLRPKPRLREEGEPPGVRKENPSKKEWEPGFQALQWKATDPDEDTLVYDVQIRGLGASEWTTLAERQLETYFTFDATAIADGRYEIKIIARDDPSNVEGDGRSASRVEGPIHVDTTPPTFKQLVADARKGKARVKFDVDDAGGGIARAELSVDGGDWVLLEPADGLSDENAERYEHDVSLKRGTYTLVVRVTDRSGNVTAREKRVKVR